MSYRPITDTWILARPKAYYYGAYPLGFLERARALLGVSIQDSVLHICSGMIVRYPYRGFGKADETLDLDRRLNPDHCQDCRSPWPQNSLGAGWRAILADPPYTEDDAAHYEPGALKLPSARELVVLAADALRVGGRFGLLHYIWPKPPKNMRSVAAISVLMGFNNRIRIYSVYEKTGETE